MSNDTKISKFMSYVLRHKPEDAGLTLDDNGWVSTQALIAAIQVQHPSFVDADLERIVKASDKQRFQMRDGRIRANQGHSVDVNLGLQPATPPAILYHGTKSDFLTSIMNNGLNKGSRHHVHLSETLDTAQIVASRRKGESTILIITTTNMPGPFFLSENGVWLTDYVAPEFITHVVS